jgi:hypothetical protein
MFSRSDNGLNFLSYCKIRLKGFITPLKNYLLIIRRSKIPPMTRVSLRQKKKKISDSIRNKPKRNPFLLIFGLFLSFEFI